jgi:phosphatidate cytidylyltransferase
MPRSKLLTRTISAAIMLPVVLGAIYIGGDVFFVGVGLVLAVATFEFVKLMECGEFYPALLFSWGFMGVGLFVTRDPSGAWLRPAVAGLLAGALVWQIFHSQRPAPTADWALTIAGGLYIGWMGGHLVALRQEVDGLQWLLLTLIITWSADTGAYLVGSNWGRRKLAPQLSPGKTVEGTIGGWLTGVVIGGLLAGLMGLGAVHGMVLGALVGVASPLGDLGISMMKRQVGAKDSGHLIPGHGGVLDRIDSILFTVAVGYYYVEWIIL